MHGWRDRLRARRAAARRPLTLRDLRGELASLGFWTYGSTD